MCEMSIVVIWERQGARVRVTIDFEVYADVSIDFCIE